MTDKEIIKALECCADLSTGCECCPGFGMSGCYKDVKSQAIDLINRLQVEVERLREICDLCNTTILEKNEQIEKLKISDASKEECTIKQHCEIKELKAEIERLKNCTTELFTLIEKISDNACKHDFSLFRTGGAGGCDMYQGRPPICRIKDNILNKYEDEICKAFKRKEIVGEE